MYRSISRKWNLAAVLLSSALLFACSGDTGPAGPAGGQGTAGPPGPGGPPGPSGSATVPVESAEKINVSIQSVTVPAGGGAPTVELRLSNDLGFGLTGLPASAMSFHTGAAFPRSERRLQRMAVVRHTWPTGHDRIGRRRQLCADNGDGTYTYTFAQALTAYAGGPVFSDTKTHRLGVEIRTNRYLPENIPANNAPYDFVPAGGAPIETRLIVNNAACNACHDNLELHGEARFDVEYCVTCHNPYSIDPDTAAEPWGGSVDMKVMIHKIHYGVNLTNGYSIVGYGGTRARLFGYRISAGRQELHDLPPGVQRGRTAGQQLAHGAEPRRLRHLPRRYRLARRGDHPGGLVFTDDTQCAGCHNETSGADCPARAGRSPDSGSRSREGVRVRGRVRYRHSTR